MESIDCVVVGAGWFGLGAAKQYKFANPDDSLVVYDAQASLGGTWAAERLYPGLKTNNLLGTFEFPDFPMDPETVKLRPAKDHIPGATVHDYLTAYATHFGILPLIQLNTKVAVAEHQSAEAGGWVLTVANKEGESKVFARRLIVATGLTSEPYLPTFKGQDAFGGRIFHGKYFLQNQDTIATAKTVTVFGAGKSAWDAVYAYATAGVQIDWVVRASGHGPCWMTPSYVSPFKIWVEKLAHVRFLTWFSPCIWGEADGNSWPRRFLHGTAVGRFLVRTLWSIIGSDVKQLSGINSHPETAKLNAWIDIMYAGTSFSILNYETDFFDLVRSGKVRVHVGEIDHLGPGQVHLADGTVLDSDVLMAHTGWQQTPPLKFLPEGIEAELGLPHRQTLTTANVGLASEKSLIQTADAEILSKFPRLKDQPKFDNYTTITEQDGIATPGEDDDEKPSNDLTPYMLYRFMVPASARLLRQRDIAFTGMVFNFSTIITAHIQGLWVSSYFSGRLVNDPTSATDDDKAMDAIRYETVLHNRFGRWRHPVDWGNKAPSFIFDAVAYFSMLLHDLGLQSRRKSGGFLREFWHPYGGAEYRDVNQEWAAKFK